MINNQFQECIDACLECASICNQCAVACLNESNVAELKRCIQLTADCADICLTVSELMGRNSEFAEKFCHMCVDICNACAAECEKFASMNEHCKLCAEVCRQCAHKCMSLEVVG